MRILIRVPEAYLLVRSYQAIRPGLMVTDADLRRVGVISLAGKTPAKVAAWLGKMNGVQPRERFLLRLTGANPPVEALRKRLAATAGVDSVKVASTNYLIAWVKPGGLPPAKLAGALGAVGAKASLLDPIRVALEPARRADAAEGLAGRLRGVPGAWYVTTDKPSAYVSRFLLDARQVARAVVDARVDVVALTYQFSALPRGGRAASIFFAALRIPGVLTVIPDLSRDKLVVIVRRGQVAPEKILGTLSAFGNVKQVVGSN